MADRETVAWQPLLVAGDAWQIGRLESGGRLGSIVKMVKRPVTASPSREGLLNLRSSKKIPQQYVEAHPPIEKKVNWYTIFEL